MRALGPSTIATAFALAVLAGSASGQESPAPRERSASDGLTIPMPPPEPPPRPAELAPPGAVDQSPAAAPAVPNPIVEAPKPPERPAELTPAQAMPAEPAPEAPPRPPQRPPELSGEAALALTIAPPDDSACRQRLERLGATFEALPAISNGQCGAARPLKVSLLAGGLALTPPATLVCGAAEALARWATEAQAAAERDLGKPLTSLSIGGSYECRGQSHDQSARLSEHSFANGVDIMGFGFSGRAAIPVGAATAGAPEATFQAAARAKACGFFRTVLGPGSDAAHANHLHLDERERTSGHRLCQ